MRRDLDLCRQVLQVVENSDGAFFAPIWSEPPSTDPVDQRWFFHARLLVDGRLLADTNGAGPYRLTSDGCDFLDVSRDDVIWREALAASGAIGGVTLTQIGQICAVLVRRRLDGA